MSDLWMDTCPRCNQPMQRGFHIRNTGLSYVAPDKLGTLIFIDEDVGQAGLRKVVPTRAQYHLSSICRACKLYVVDFSRSYSTKEAQELAEKMAAKL